MIDIYLDWYFWNFFKIYITDISLLHIRPFFSLKYFLFQFVCGTRYHGDRLTDESMKMHIPNGSMYTSFVAKWINQQSFSTTKTLIKREARFNECLTTPKKAISYDVIFHPFPQYMRPYTVKQLHVLRFIIKISVMKLYNKWPLWCIGKVLCKIDISDVWCYKEHSSSDFFPSFTFCWVHSCQNSTQLLINRHADFRIIFMLFPLFYIA